MFADAATADFFRARLDHMIDLRQPLVVLASRMPWQQIEASLAHLFSRKAHTGLAMPDLDLFGEAALAAARQSNAGRPRIPLRTMIALLYLKHAFDLSDEAVVERWSDSPNMQYFPGMAYFEPCLPCDATTLVKFRRLLGEEGVEELLSQTITAAVSLKLIPAAALATVVVDSTVQEKAVAHTTDSKLLETARSKLVAAAQDTATTAYTPPPLTHLGSRPSFLLAPMSYADMLHGRQIANGLANLIATVGDHTPHDRIHGAPRWGSAQFLENVRQYPNAIDLDLACSPHGRAFVQRLCESAGVEKVSMTPPNAPLIADFEDRPIFFLEPTSFIASMHAAGIAAHSGRLVASVDDHSSTDTLHGAPRWSTHQFLEHARKCPNALAIDFSYTPNERGMAHRLCALAGVEKLDAVRAIAHCGQHAVYEPARAYRQRTLSRLDDFLRLAERLDDEFSVFTLYSNLMFRLTYERSHLLPAWATPVDEYFSASGDTSTFQLGQHEHFCDCGAFQGSMVQKFLEGTNSQYESMTAFEPDIINFQKLQDITSPCTPHFHAINKAVSDVQETLRFQETETVASHASPSGSISVAATRLDDELEKLTLLKMDIEGFEPKALAGASRLISTQRPRIAACVYHYALDLLDVVEQIDRMADNYHFRLRQHSSAFYYDLVLYASPIAGVAPPLWAA